MAGRILALTRPAVFRPKAAKICCRISQRIRAVSTRFMAQDLETRGGGDTHVGRRPRNRLQELAAFAVLCRSAYPRSEEHTSELQSLRHLVCRLLLEKKKTNKRTRTQVI